MQTMIPAVLSQHSDEAAFLWLLRKGAVDAPHYSLPDLAKLDGRVEAHLDALRIAGDDGWKFCEEQLAANEEGEVFAAGVLAAQSGTPEFFDKVLAAVEAEPKLAGGLISALGWLPFEQVELQIRQMIESGNALHQIVGIGAMAVHRRHPGPFLRTAACSEVAGLRTRALKAAGELHDGALEVIIGDSLRAEQADVRFAAAWSGVVLGMSEALPVLREIAESDSPGARRAVATAARRLDLGEAAAWRQKLAGDPKRLRAAILMAGAVGDPVCVPWLISLMSELPLARLAGEAFTMITGVDLAYRDLERKPPEDFNAGPTEDPRDENVEMDPDDNLPWPEPSLVQKWWDQNRGQFQDGARYLLGKQMTVEWLKVVLRDGRQRHRAAAALELAIRQPGQPLFNVAAPGFRQVQELGKTSAVIR